MARTARLYGGRRSGHPAGSGIPEVLEIQPVHRFAEELRQVVGEPSLYNESLGTTSDSYMYDRVKGRDLPLAERPVPAWRLPLKS
jgi:hypothetical protein